MKIGLFVLLATSAWGQALQVYSEFAKIDESGKVIAPESPREILSPMVARNAFSSFQIVVQVPKETEYQLWVAQNPENAARIELYRESGDSLIPITLPFEGTGTAIFWMDAWTAGDARVGRIKVEPQLHVNNDWITYPIEARIMDAVAGDSTNKGGSDSPPVVMHQFLCQPRKELKYGPQSAIPKITNMRFRNSLQDLSLAAKAPKPDLQKVFGSCNSALSSDPEWYLKIRDYLFRLP